MVLKRTTSPWHHNTHSHHDAMVVTFIDCEKLKTNSRVQHLESRIQTVLQTPKRHGGPNGLDCRLVERSIGFFARKRKASLRGELFRILVVRKANCFRSQLFERRTVLDSRCSKGKPRQIFAVQMRIVFRFKLFRCEPFQICLDAVRVSNFESQTIAKANGHSSKCRLKRAFWVEEHALPNSGHIIIGAADGGCPSINLLRSLSFASLDSSHFSMTKLYAFAKAAKL